MKFSIRDLQLVTLTVAVLFGWLVDHWRMSRVISEIERLEYVGRADIAKARAEATELREQLREKNGEPPNYLIPATSLPKP